MAKNEFKYHLKKDVREDLENLSFKIDYLLREDLNGFPHVPIYYALPELFKAFSHFIRVSSYVTWFKKVYM